MKSSYTYGLERISRSRNGVKHYYVSDGQGSVRALTDTAGTITDSYYYTAFGEELAKTGTTENEFRYVGEQWDPNAGFYYLRARWYDQSTGRFASVDPFDGKSKQPISLHRYIYANVSPITHGDPSGKITSLLEAQSTFVINSILQTTIISGFVTFNIFNLAGQANSNKGYNDPEIKPGSGQRRDRADICIQFQIGSDRKRNWSRSISAPIDEGVTKAEAVELLYELYYTLPSFWTRALSKWTATHVSKMEDKINNCPSIGPESKNYFREQTTFRDENHRIDLQNNSGVNLRY